MNLTTLKRSFLYASIVSTIFCYIVYYNNRRIVVLDTFNKIFNTNTILNGYCNPIYNGVKGHEGKNPIPNYHLSSIVIIMRHGDRPSISSPHRAHDGTLKINGHVLSAKDLCQSETKNGLYIWNYTQKIVSLTNAKRWPCKLPTSIKKAFEDIMPSKYCWVNIGMTQNGLAQNINLGLYLKYQYFALKKIGKLYLYSTKMHRTYQSIVALLYGLLGPTQFEKLFTTHDICPIQFHNNHLFCRLKNEPNPGNGFCQCPINNKPSVGAKKGKKPRQSHFKISKVKLALGKIIFPLYTAATLARLSSRTLFDTLAAPLCHDPQYMNQSITKTYLSSTLVCRLKPYACVSEEQIEALFEDLNLTRAMNLADPNYIGVAGAHAKSLLNYVVNYAFNSKHIDNFDQNPDLHIISGHDTTLEPLLTTLGSSMHYDISQVESLLIPYTARLVFELWKANKNPKSPPRIRVLYNGELLKVANFLPKSRRNISHRSNGSVTLNNFVRRVNLVNRQYSDLVQC